MFWVVEFAEECVWLHRMLSQNQLWTYGYRDLRCDIDEAVK